MKISRRAKQHTALVVAIRKAELGMSSKYDADDVRINLLRAKLA